MYKPRIGLIVDHPQRDLAGLLLTAFELCQRGAICYLVPLNLQRMETWALAPDFVLLNYLRRSNEKFAGQLAAAGIKFGVLDTEGGVWANVEHYTELFPESADVRKQASCVCMWGPRMAEHIVAQNLFSEAQVVVTGCPRFDFYDLRWQAALGDALDRAADQPRRRILINTNFPVVNSRFASAERNIEQLCAMYGWSAERMTRYIDAEQQAIEATIDMARKIAGDYPESSVVVRPHPFEEARLYRQKLSDLANIEINVVGPVQPQIFQSDVVIQRSCTTAIEANLAARPTLSPQWVPAPSVIPIAENVSVPCESYADMHTVLDAILSDRYRPTDELRQTAAAVAQDWFYRIDGMAYRRVSDAILDRLSIQPAVDRRRCQKYLSGLDAAPDSSFSQLSAHARYWLGLSPDWSFRRLRRVPSLDWAKTEKYYGADEVRVLVERIGAVASKNNPSLKPVSVELARESGDYLRPYYGHAVKLQAI